MLDKKQAKHNLKQCRLDIGNQITKLRKTKGLTIEALGYDTGVARLHLEKLELGILEINIGLIHTLAHYFNKRIKVELVD